MPGNIILASFPYRFFIAEAVIKRTYSNSFSAEALIAKLSGQTFTFTASASIAVSSGNWLEASFDTTLLTADIICSMSDSNVVTLIVQRENPETGAWTDIYTTYPRNAFFTDTNPPLNTPFRYRGRGYDSNGDVIQSVTTYPLTLTTPSDYGWSVSDGVNSLPLMVTGSSLEKELQTEVFSPLGKSFKTVQVGEQLGRKGSIEFFIESGDRRETLAMLDTIVNSTRETYLRTPFGLVLQVAFGSISESMLPGGHSKISMDYIENGES